MLLNNEPQTIRPTLTHLDSVELNYYPFMFNLDKRDGRYNAIDGLSTKICVLSKTKDINVKVFKGPLSGPRQFRTSESPLK